MATLTFDRTTNGIQVDLPDTEIIIQDLVNLIRVYEDNIESMSFSKILDASGKDRLGGGRFVGITAVLLDPWELFFEARTGPAITQCFVRGGNLIAVDALNLERPAMRESAFTFAVIEQSTSASLIEEATHADHLKLTQFLALKDG